MEFPYRIIDLTHPLQPGMPVWPGDPPLAITPAAGLDREGYYLNRLTLGEHTGSCSSARASRP